MQTFLPYPSFKRSAEVLDYKRLGKMRVEAWQILRALRGQSTGWRNHPAVRMWRGFEVALARYGACVCREWVARGYRDTMLPRFDTALAELGSFARTSSPAWLGNPNFHAAHRSNLLRKDPVWYGRFGWTEPSDLPYVWP